MQIGRRRLIERNCSKSELIGPDLERRGAATQFSSGRSSEKKEGGVSVERNPAGNAPFFGGSVISGKIILNTSRGGEKLAWISRTRLEGRDPVQK